MSLTLPQPPSAYQAQDQAQTRLQITQALNAINSKPGYGKLGYSERVTYVEDFGAVGDGVTDDAAAFAAAIASGQSFQLQGKTYYVNANLNVTTVANHGQTISGAGSVAGDGTGTAKSIIKAGASVTALFTTDGTSFAGYVQGVGFRDFAVDMSSVPDLSTNIAFHQVQAFDCRYDNVRVLNYETAKLSWLFSTGSFVSKLSTCQGGIVKFVGTSPSNATTTIALENCDIASIDANYAMGISMVGGAVQRPYNASVPVIYLAPGLTPYGYVPNTGGLYAAIMSKIDNVVNFTSTCCDWEQGGGYPGTYNDGAHGTLTLIQVIQVTASATNTTIETGGPAGAYVLDAGLNTRLPGYQLVGVNLTGGRNFHFGPIETSSEIIGFTDFPTYFGSGLTVTYSIAASTGAAALQLLTVKPAADGDKILHVKNAAGDSLYDFTTNGAGLALNNGTNLGGYTDNFTTQAWKLDSTTGILRLYSGGTQKIILTPSNSSVNVAVGGFYAVNGVAVVAGRQTGWTAPTGTISRGTFDQSTVTLPELAKRLAALIDDLTSHGLIGA